MGPTKSRIIAGKYQLLDVAGEGGMASVWRAVTLGAAGFTRPVAVKQILDSLAADQEFVAMFVEEARVVSQLSHPNIVQIHDFGIDESGIYFLVMEWVDGMDLLAWRRAHLAARRPTPWHLLSALGIEALKGLSSAHERVDDRGRRAPVYHRDVTPQNILLSKDGIVKLSDFGLARAMDRARMTRPDIVKGKLSYVAPELALGGEPSVQSDIFSLGVVLYEALVGRKLFDGENAFEIIMKVRAHKAAPEVHRLRPDVPREISEVIRVALEPAPENRHPSAKQMAQALATILRSWPERTDADELAESVRRARHWLGAGKSEPPESDTVVDSAGSVDLDAETRAIDVHSPEFRRAARGMIEGSQDGVGSRPPNGSPSSAQGAGRAQSQRPPPATPPVPAARPPQRSQPPPLPGARTVPQAASAPPPLPPSRPPDPPSGTTDHAIPLTRRKRR